MGIFDRLGHVIKSYLNDEDVSNIGRTNRERPHGGDPDLDAAFEELNDFLRGDSEGNFRQSSSRRDAWSGLGDEGFGGAFRKAGSGGSAGAAPEALRQDFAELGLGLGATAEECKAAYKNLLKIHHPDRHAGHPGNMQKATDKSARINAAYDRIGKWRATGGV